VDSVNLFHAKTLRFTRSQDWYQSEGSVIGYEDSKNHGYPFTLDSQGNSPVMKFVIPLEYISPVFNPENSQYLPPFLASGMRVEIGLENGNTAFRTSGSGSGSLSYQILDPSIQTDLVKMSDKVDSVMTARAHKSGLELVFSEWDTFSTVSSSQKNTIDINKTASKADKLIVCSRQSANVSNPSVDSMESEPFAYNEFQSRVGSVYHPQTPITEYREGFQNALYTMKSMRKNQKDYPFASMETYEKHDGTKGGFAILGTNLNRSSLIDSQCVPLNNSHSLSVNVGFTSASSRQIDCFLIYKKIVKVFTNNCIVFE